MTAYQVFQVDAFTRTRFRGNPAGVVLDADGLTDAQMQDIARELGNSETAFIHPARARDHDVWVRFFTPITEVPICGHATIAAHHVRARELGLPSGRVVQLTGAGALPVDITREGDDCRVTMTQGAVEFGAPFGPALSERTLRALGVGSGDVDRRCPIQIVSTGHSKVLVGLRDATVLDALSPDLPALAALSAEIGCNGFFAFALTHGEPELLSRGRMFAPAIGIAEDPVTGNANGPLGAYLVRHRLAPHDGRRLTFRTEQGRAIRRSGTMEVEVEIREGEPTRVRVTGDAVIVFRTEIEL
jgi:PhzF family phenazine biosynthesis protein